MLHTVAFKILDVFLSISLIFPLRSRFRSCSVGEVLNSDCFLPSLCAHSSATSSGPYFKAPITISLPNVELDVCELELLGQFQVEFDALMSRELHGSLPKPIRFFKNVS